MKAINETISFASKPRRKIFGWRQDNSIGIVSPSYGTEKISYGCSPNGYSFHKVSRVPIQRLENIGTFLNYTPVILDYPVELVHTFNALPIGLRPFVVSFENELPRYLGKPSDWQLEIGLNLMDSARCKAILSLSEIAATLLKTQLTRIGRQSTADKVHVFRGTVSASSMSNQIDIRQVRHESDPLRILFVGRDAFGKGLPPVIAALEECIRLGANIDATIVCNFEERRYISKGYCVDNKDIQNRIASNSRIAHHYLLPNSEIQRLMASHDVLLFPTLDESLGWVAIEAALAGMVVITTNIFALPELVQHGETGFIINISKNENQRWCGLQLQGNEFDNEVENTFQILHHQMVHHILHLESDSNLQLAMSCAAKEYINSMYSSNVASAELEKIYSAATK